MPESSEVTLTTEILCKYLCGKKLTKVVFESGRYEKNHPEGFTSLEKKLPLKLADVNSKGKFIWFDFTYKKDGVKKHIYAWNTLGLFGLWTMYRPTSCRYKFVFEDSNRKKLTAYYSDRTSYGTLKFTTDKDALDSKLKKLGPDVLKEDFDLSKVSKYKTPIVKILMDQNKVISGVGNYLSVEALYKAKISPHRIGSDLSDEEIENLTYALKYIVKLAYTNNEIGYMVGLADEGKNIKKINYHPDIKLKKGIQFKFQVYQRDTDRHGNKIRADKNLVKDRTTYWCPAVQKN